MLRPDIQWNNPVMFVVLVGASLPCCTSSRRHWEVASQVSMGYFIALDAGFSLPCSSRISPRPLRRRAARPRPISQEGPPRHLCLPPERQGGRSRKSPRRTLSPATGRRRGGANNPRRRRNHRRHRLRRRIGHHRRIAPVIRAAGGDRSGVTGGTVVLSDRIVVQITSGAGESFLDRMIALVEGAIRQRSPNEIALTLLLSAFTLSLSHRGDPSLADGLERREIHEGLPGRPGAAKSLGTDVPTLIALLVCLIPTTIGALLAAIGIAGMDRALQANIIAKSGKAVELAGDIDVVLLDKTGTITIGNRNATTFLPVRSLYRGRCGAACGPGLRSRRHPRGQKHRAASSRRRAEPQS